VVAATQRGQVAWGRREAAGCGVDIQVEAVAAVGLPVGVARGRLPGADRLLRLILAVDIVRDLVAHDLLEPLAAFVIAIVYNLSW